MKVKFITLSLLLLFLLISFSQVTAQEGELPKSQMFLIHEDEVLPYMTDKYEAAVKNFVKVLTDSKVEETSFSVTQVNYTTYSFVTPVNDYDGLAKYFGMSDAMVEKVGKDKFDQAMSQFDGCYDTHRNYLLTLRNDLSYKATVGLDPEEGLNFRHFDYYYVVPGKEDEMIEILKEWKALFEAKNIEQAYRVYIGGIGTHYQTVIMVKPDKGRVEWAISSDKRNELGGEEWDKLLDKTISIVQKFDHMSGRMRPDLFYMP